MACGPSSCPWEAPAALLMDSFISTPPMSLQPALSRPAASDGPIFTQLRIREGWGRVTRMPIPPPELRQQASLTGKAAMQQWLHAAEVAQLFQWAIGPQPRNTLILSAPPIRMGLLKGKTAPMISRNGTPTHTPPTPGLDAGDAPVCKDEARNSVQERALVQGGAPPRLTPAVQRRLHVHKGQGHELCDQAAARGERAQAQQVPGPALGALHRPKHDGGGGGEACVVRCRRNLQPLLRAELVGADGRPHRRVQHLCRRARQGAQTCRLECGQVAGQGHAQRACPVPDLQRAGKRVERKKGAGEVEGGKCAGTWVGKGEELWQNAASLLPLHTLRTSWPCMTNNTVGAGIRQRWEALRPT